MKTRKTWLIAGVAAAAIAFQAGGPLQPAYADDDDDDYTVQVQIRQINPEDLLQKRLKNVILDTMTVSGVDSDVFENALHNGSTLAAASGMRDSELLAKLVGLVNQDAKTAVANGILKSDAVAGLLRDARSQYETLIGKTKSELQSEELGAEIIKSKLDSLVQYVAAFSDQDTNEVYDLLDAGKTLYEASGLDSSELMNQLLGLVEKDLDSHIALGDMKQDEKQQWLDQAEEQFEKALSARQEVKPKTPKPLPVTSDSDSDWDDD